MKKITFNTLPEAISQLLERMEKIEKLLSKKSSLLKSKTKTTKVRKPRRQETPAGLLSVKDAGKLLKMSLVNLYSYVKNKKIPFEKRGRRLYFSKTDLETWNKNRNNQGVSGDNITIKDAEKLLKVPSSTIYYKIKSQKLSPVTKRGNKLLFSKRELINAFGKPTKRGRKVTKTGKPAKVAKTVKPSKAIKTAKVVKPVKAAKPAKAAKTKVMKPAKTTRPGKVVKRRKTTKPPKVPKAPKPENTAKPENAPLPVTPENETSQSNPETGA